MNEHELLLEVLTLLKHFQERTNRDHVGGHGEVTVRPISADMLQRADAAFVWAKNLSLPVERNLW